MANAPDRGKQPLPHREIHLRDLVAVVARHWFLVLVLTAFVGGSAWFTSRSAIPQYQSTLTVQINSPKQVFARLDDIDVDEFALRTDPILSEALFLTTHELALRVVARLGLQLEMTDPATFRGSVFSSVSVDTSAARLGEYQLVLRGAAGYEVRDAAGGLLVQGTYNDPAIGPGFSFMVQPRNDQATIDFRIVTADQAASWIGGGIAYTVRPSTNAVDISYTGTDPTLVPGILNASATELRNDGARRAREIANQRRRYIAEQTRSADSSFRDKLRELQTFKERQQITDLSAEEEAIVSSIQEFEQERSMLLVQLSTIRDAMSSGSDTIGIETLNQLAAIEGIGNNTALNFQINNLLELYEERRRITAGALGLSESNPRVAAIVQRTGDGHRALRAAVDATMRSLNAHLDAIEDKVAEQRGVLATYPGKETQIAQLELEANIINDTYRYLLGQYEAARLQEATIAPYVDILDGAAPSYRIGTTVRQKVILGAMVGFLLGLAAAFFLEYLDQTVKSASDIERILGVPVLGMIPDDAKLFERVNGTRALVTVDRLEADDPAVESYRALRTNVTFVSAEKPVQFIAVTSPGPREGKSTTATNLAMTLAQNGQRTLLIDGDLRRPQVHKAFGLVQDPGLTNLLIGQADLREAIRPEVVAHLDFIPSGAIPPNPSELLGSDAMRSLITNLRRDYEYIVVDTPPTLPVTDASIVATNADATILVIRSGDTEEHAAESALRQLQRVRARVAGAVLNGVSEKRDRKYTYYSYRRVPPARTPLGGLRSRLANLI